MKYIFLKDTPVNKGREYYKRKEHSLWEDQKKNLSVTTLPEKAVD